MVRSKREFILATCFLSGIGAILNLVAIGTQQWVASDGEFIFDGANSESPSYINYGLFSGVLEQNYGGTNVYELQSKYKKLRKLYTGWGWIIIMLKAKTGRFRMY